MSSPDIQPLALSGFFPPVNNAAETERGAGTLPSRAGGTGAPLYLLSQLRIFDNAKVGGVTVPRPDISDPNATSTIRRPHLSRGNARSAPMDPIDAARQHLERSPELMFLADPSVDVTSEAAGRPIPVDSYSARLGMPGFFPELERTLLSLQSLKWIIDGSREAHEIWTSPQTENKLDYASFRTLSDRWHALVARYVARGVQPDELERALERALVFSDLPKADRFRTMMAEVGIHAADHDDFIGKVMDEPRALEKLGSFQQLTPAMQNLLRTTANLAHFGHITQCEGGPEMFRKLKKTDIANRDPAAFEFAAFVYRCDVAGARGHVNAQGSITFNQTTFEAVELGLDACRHLKDTDEVGACKFLVGTRARWLGLSPLRDDGMMLGRLGGWTRLTTKSHGVALNEGFSKLSVSDRESAVPRLSVEGASKLRRTPTYMPALLDNLIKHAKFGTHQEGVIAAITIGVPFIVSTLEKYEAMVDAKMMSDEVPLNFNPAAGIAASNPDRLLRKDLININPETGAVTILDPKTDAVTIS